MRQKVISVTTMQSPEKGAFNEFEYPEVKKALEEGYFVRDVHISQATTLACCVIVFVLEK